MKEATILKITTLICGTAICISAMIMGHDSNLAWIAIVALFGGEKVLERIRGKKNNGT